MSGELEKHLIEAVERLESGAPFSMEEITKTMQGDFAEFAKSLRRLSAFLPAPELNGELSADEREFVPEANARPWKPNGLPVAEIDATLKIGGDEIAVTLAVWGKFHAYHAGGHEPGERAYEPDDEAGFEVEAILMGEVDVTAELGQEGERAIVAYCMENVEPDSDFCEDRR